MRCFLQVEAKNADGCKESQDSGIYICAVLRRNNFIKPDITMIVTLWFLAGTQ